MAICNSWLCYKIDNKHCSNIKNKCTDLLSLRNNVANGVIARFNQQACSCKRGCPKKSSYDISVSPSTSDKGRKITPANLVRYDGN